MTDQPTADEPQDHPAAELYVLLRKAGEDRDTAQQLIYAHAAMVIRQHKALNSDTAPAVEQPAEAHPPLTVDDLAHALDNTTPYPIELDMALCRFMAARLLEMVTAAKRPEHEVWQPDEEPQGEAPEPLDPAVEQPAEAQPAVARPPQSRWRVEGYDADEWNPISRSFSTPEDAHTRKRASRRYPDQPTRVVRETTTWTVEEGPR